MDSGENKDKANTNEPDAGFNNNRIVFFNSFEEAEDYDNKWLAAQTPEQHLNNAIQLIKRHYTKELKLMPDIGIDFKID